jgi:hypothetical protein
MHLRIGVWWDLYAEVDATVFRFPTHGYSIAWRLMPGTQNRRLAVST